MLNISIIIPSYNAKDELRECLKSVFKYINDLNFEVLVIDNASTEENVKMLENCFPQVVVIKNPTNLGFAKASNIGIKSSKGKYILLLNSDTKMIENTPKILCNFMERYEAYGIVSPLLVDMNTNKIQRSSRRRFPSLWREFLVLTSLARHNILNFLGCGFYVYDYERDKDVNVVPGTCMMIRRSAMEEIGLLDESFFFLGEDMDYCWRMRQAGWKVASLAQSRILHLHGGSYKTEEQRLKVSLEHCRSRSILFRKHKGIIYERIWRLLLSLASIGKITYQGILNLTNKDFKKNRYLLNYHFRIFRWAITKNY